MDALFRLVLTNAALSGLLALAAWAASRFVRRQAVVHALWLLALVKLVTPPLVSLPLLPSPGAAPEVRADRGAERKGASAATAAKAIARPPAPAGPRLAPPVRGDSPARETPLLPAPSGALPVAVASRADGLGLAAAARLVLPLLLVLGALAVAGLSALRFARFRRLLSAAEPAPDDVARRAAALAEGIGVRRAPPVLLLPARVPPMLWPSAAGPLLLLPRELLPVLDGEELDALLAHELAHVRRRDHWVRFLEIGATALFWWYPVTWWSRRALRRAEERCCDEWVLRALPSSARAYASGILKSLELLSGPLVPVPSAASGAGPIDDLESRLKEILMTYPLPRLSRPVRAVLAGAAVAALALSPTAAPARSAQAAAPIVLPEADETPAPSTPAPPPSRAPLAPPAVPGTPVPSLAPSAPVAAGASPRTPHPYLAAGGTPVALREDGEVDPALAAERLSLDEQRRQLELAQLELQRKTIDLEAKVRRKETSSEAARLRSEGDAEAAARVEKRGALDDKRVALERRHVDLEVQQTKLAAEMDRTAAAAENPGSAAARSYEEVMAKSRALEAETEKLDREIQALDAELRVHELRGATANLAESLAQQVASLREALPESGAQKAELEREIQRLEAALAALEGSAPKARTAAPPKAAVR